MSVNHSARSGVIIGIFLVFFNMKVFCVLSLESPHRGDSNECTQHTIFNIKRKIDQNNPAQVRNSHGKRIISVRAIEVLLYIVTASYVYMYIPTSESITHKYATIAIMELQTGPEVIKLFSCSTHLSMKF